MQNLKHELLKIKSDDLIFYFIVLTFFLLPTGTAPPLISIGFAAIFWIVSKKFFTIKSMIRKSWFFPVIPFLVLPWIGLLYSQNTDLGMDYAMKTKYWLVLFITAGIALDGKRVHLILKWFWAGLFMGAVLALFQLVGLAPTIREQFLGFGIVYTLISIYLVIGILTASFYFKTAKNRKEKIILLILIISFLFHLIVLKGRSGYLIFGIMSPFVANNLMHSFSLKFKIALCLLLVFSLAASPVVRTLFKTNLVKLSDQREKIQQGVYSEHFPRFFIIPIAIETIMAHPFIGIGTGSFTEPTRAKGQAVSHPHNNFLHMGTSYGIIGIAACCWLFWEMFKRSWQSRNTALGFFIFSSCSVLFLSGMFDTQILNTGTLLFLSLTYGLLNHLPPLQPQ